MDPDLLDLPLGVKIYVKPKSKLVLCRGKLGEKLHGLSPSFNLDDPYMHHLNLQYNCLHDPHLQDYHKRKDVLQMLKKQGFVTSENKVICTVKEFNEYRQYLTRIKMESEQILGQEKKSKETTLKSGRFRRGKGALDKGQTNSTAELGQQDASRAADSKRKPDNTSDGLFKAVLEKLTMAEAQKLQELVKTVAYKVFVRLKVPGDQRVSFLRKTAQGIRGNGFGSSVKTEPAETPLDHRQELEMVAKELTATVLEILGNRLESKASEPGRAARQKEKPVDGGATQAETSKEAETGRERIHACLDDLTIQVVKHVHCLLKSMTAAQFRGDSSCEYTEILKLPKGKVSNRQMQQAISGSSKEQSQKASTGVKLPALGPQLRAKGTGYAKTMEPEDSAMVKESLIRALQDTVLQMEASQAAQEKQLLKELEESRAAEGSLRDSVHVLEAEVSELRVKLQSSVDRAEALATQCQQASGAHQETQSQLDKLLLDLHHMIRDSRDLGTWSSGKCGRLEEGHVMGLTASQTGDVPAELTVDGVAAALQDLQQHLEHSQKDLNDARKKIQALELELGTGQDQMDNLRASNEELQIQLDESRAAMLKAVQQKTSLETALKEETIALKEEAVTLHQEVASLQKKLENLENERKDVLVIKDITEKEQKTESQQEQIQELEKQQEKQRIVLSKMSQELEEKDQEIKSQQELIRELEKQLEFQNSAVSRVSKELEERQLEIKFQEEKIMI
ncbi:unnamed protein product [Coccothraustes coccothraustes]